MATLFPKTYETSRARFRARLSEIQARWPNARLESHALAVNPDLTIDWIQADALESPQKRLIVTTGEHGIEGYVGAAMLQLLIDEFLPRLDPSTTGLLLVHAINPWGMQQRRRVNAQNVDINRNFLTKEADFQKLSNQPYAALNTFLNPGHEMSAYRRERRRFWLHLLKTLAGAGKSALQAATLQGQYQFPQGIYYGGQSWQEEAQTMMALYRAALDGYAQVVHLDMHTGYGPREQMTLVNSPLEKRSPAELSALFGYPQIVAATPDDFYAIHGDMIDWMYVLKETEYPAVQLYSTTFEFGTLGEDLPAVIRSLQSMIFENQVFWHGAADEATRQAVQQDFLALFFPQESEWQQKALADARQAMGGILQALGFIG